VAPSLEEVIYDLARSALDEQREVVAGLRSRAAPVLAGAGALAALLARPAIGDGVSFGDQFVHALQRYLVGGLVGVALEVAGFATAVAVHS